MSETPPSRALITEAAAELLRRLQARHGALIHQSGGCCDGSSPMCYLDGEFLVGDRDVLLSILDVGSDGVPVWISGPQFEAWKHTQHWLSTSCRDEAAGSASRHPKECGS